MLLHAPQLTANHPLRREAVVLSDAFEAVTNGMETPEVMEALLELSGDSLFQSWKHLVLAIHFFYEGLDEASVAHLRHFVGSASADSPINTLGGALLSILAESLRPGSRAHGLSARLHVADPELSILTQQITDALEGGHEGLFWSVLADFLEVTSVQAGTLARRVALWSWNQLAWQQFDEEPLLEITTQLWGKAEAFRLAALGTLPWDAEGAALLWGKFLIHGLREDLLWGSTLAEAQTIALEFYQAANQEPQDGSDSREWNDTWRALGNTLRVELALRSLAGPSWVSRVPQVEAPLKISPSVNGQLDLFAS
jgi:hypothetical protein